MVLLCLCRAWQTRHREWLLWPSRLAARLWWGIVGPGWPHWDVTILSKGCFVWAFVCSCMRAPAGLGMSCTLVFGQQHQHSTGCRGISLSLPFFSFDFIIWPPSKVPVAVGFFCKLRLTEGWVCAAIKRYQLSEPSPAHSASLASQLHNYKSCNMCHYAQVCKSIYLMIKCKAI